MKLGPIKIKIIEFFGSVMTMNHETIIQIIRQNDVISIIFDYFIYFKWHNILHSIVEKIYNRLFLRENFNEYLTDLFVKFKFIEKLIGITADCTK